MAERYHPDVLVVDMMMPGLNGLEVTRQVRQRSPGTRIIVLSMHNKRRLRVAGLKRGASGYILKDSGRRRLSRR